MQVKLVRDHCGAAYNGECEAASTDGEYQMALLLKLHEEAQEIADAPDDPEEYADLLEVMLALANLNDVSGEAILEALVGKRRAVGGFEDGLIWTEELPLPCPNFTVEVSARPSEPIKVPEWLSQAMKARSWHALAFRKTEGGFTDGNDCHVVSGDRVEYRFENNRRGVLDEALQDGDAYVTWDDGAHATVKWKHLAKIPEGD